MDVVVGPVVFLPDSRKAPLAQQQKRLDRPYVPPWCHTQMRRELLSFSGNVGVVFGRDGIIHLRAISPARNGDDRPEQDWLGNECPRRVAPFQEEGAEGMISIEEAALVNHTHLFV